MTGEFVQAWRAEQLVCLAVSRTVAEGLLGVLDDVECSLTGRRRRFGRRPRPLPDRRLFPDAYFDREASEEFRARHGRMMRNRVLDAVRRTSVLFAHAHESGDEPAVVTVPEVAVADVFCALGHAQSLFLSRPRWNALVDWPTVTLLKGGRELTWLVTCQTALADAALATVPEPGDEEPLTPA
ncbi:DUF2017 family protein [Saccharomonospora xinjiangensis]|uniref:Uncharacterized protein n=1 Tax=Saccharomonospora xinjiangensis XJ-54 TaxID=882086 RepID=I0V5P2_9PSEU|nr:hypothetical protein [Saccharomonospora xinjiangensis]EID55445.1 hypothetical protein SacxiDRAFT_3239 [Saccharomonospora xinjiangensis XJ-54]